MLVTGVSRGNNYWSRVFSRPHAAGVKPDSRVGRGSILPRDLAARPKTVRANSNVQNMVAIGTFPRSHVPTFHAVGLMTRVTHHRNRSLMAGTCVLYKFNCAKIE